MQGAAMPMPMSDGEGSPQYAATDAPSYRSMHSVPMPMSDGEGSPQYAATDAPSYRSLGSCVQHQPARQPLMLARQRGFVLTLSKAGDWERVQMQ